jgi:tetratricopeptide (TPR) repeat protein
MIINRRTWPDAARIIAAAVVTALTISLSAQEDISAPSPSGNGEDSTGCKQNTSIYLSYYQKKDFSTALIYWRQVFNECPASSEDIYINGETMYTELYRSTGDTSYIDTLVLTVSQRTFYFDNIPSNYIHLAQVLYELAGDNAFYTEQSYILLNEVADSYPDHADPNLPVLLMSVAARAYSLKIIDIDELALAYSKASDMVENKLRANPGDRRYIKATESIDSIFRESGAMICGIIEKIFSEKVDRDFKNTALVNKVFSMLSEKGCYNSDLYYRIAASMFANDRSVENAVRLAELNIVRKNTDKVTWYFSEAYKLDTNRIVRSGVLTRVAAWELESGKRQEARDHGEEAYKMDNRNGKALFIIAEAYAGSEIGDKFDNHSVYWVAADYFRSAEVIDPSLKKEADEKIKACSKLFPTKEECYYKRITEEGITFMVGGWINEVTRVRFRQE